jgi:hypothetical protein
MPAGNVISMAEIGSIAHIAPNAIDTTTIATSVLPNEVQMQWKAATEAPSGSGALLYQVLRNGSYEGNSILAYLPQLRILTRSIVSITNLM